MAEQPVPSPKRVRKKWQTQQLFIPQPLLVDNNPNNNNNYTVNNNNNMNPTPPSPIQAEKQTTVIGPRNPTPTSDYQHYNSYRSSTPPRREEGITITTSNTPQSSDPNQQPQQPVNGVIKRNPWIDLKSLKL